MSIGVPVLQESYEETFARGLKLAESWGNMSKGELAKFGFGTYPKDVINFMEGVSDDPHRRALMGHLFENSRRLYETTTTDNVGTFPKYMFSLIKAVYANIPTADLFSVQPLPGPVGLIFYYSIIAGSNKGNIAKGTTLFDAKGGPQTDIQDYMTSKIPSELIGTGTGAEDTFTGNLGWVPVMPGSVVITDGSQVVTDDGAGNLTGNVGSGNNTVDYVTGAFDVTFASNPSGSAQIVCDYSYNMESSGEVPEVEIVMEQSPVYATMQALKAKWSWNAQLNLQNLYGVNVESDNIGFLGNELQKEMYNRIVNQARVIAPSGYVEWDRVVPFGVSEVEHRNSITMRVTEGSNRIFSRTQRFGADWLLCGTNFANYIEALPSTYFTRNTNVSGAGVHKIGTLSTGQTVWKDPVYPTNEGLLGHKGTTPLDTGIVHAIYVGLYQTDVIRLDDFKARVGLANLSAIKVVNNKYYQKMRIVG